jgi:hypothetical protein
MQRQVFGFGQGTEQANQQAVAAASLFTYFNTQPEMVASLEGRAWVV